MFLYSLVNPGYEALLKAEVAFRHPEFTPSFSRPGYVTFKGPASHGVPTFWFARANGVFLAKGKAADAKALIDQHSSGRVVHFFDLLMKAATGEPAGPETEILDVVDLGDGELWLGHRTVKPYRWSIPAGLPLLVLPVQAPSRAWLKLEEVLLWSGWAPEPTTVAVELGSAPGGASWALLQRGVQLTGVDVAAMNDVCLSHPGYTHVALSVRDLRKKHLPVRIDALFCDLGLSPVEAIPQLRELCHLHPEISRLFYTLKWGEGIPMATLQKHLDALHTLGFTLRCTHLPSNRAELTVVGTRKPT